MAGLLDGAHNVAGLPFNPVACGAELGGAVSFLNPGRTFLVRGNGTTVTGYDYDPPGLQDRLNASVVNALAQTSSGRGDTIVVLPGHTENVATAAAWTLKAGVKILCLGSGQNRPTFTFTTAASQIVVSVANVTIDGGIWKAAGPAGTTALTVAAPFSVTAAGFTFQNAEMEVGIDADQLCTNVFLLAAGAKDCTVQNCYIYGALLSEVTTVITTTGAVDRLKIIGNTIDCAIVTAATGVLLDLSNAAIIENNIMYNILRNKEASAVYVIKPHASSTGNVIGNFYGTGDGGTTPATSAWTTFTTNYLHQQNFCVTAVGKSGLLCPVADA